MYIKNVVGDKLSKPVTIKSARQVGIIILATVSVACLRFFIGLYFYREPRVLFLLNILAIVLYINIIMTLFRKVIINEKKRLVQIRNNRMSQTLGEISKLELRNDTSSTFEHFGKIYIPQINGMSTIFIEFTHNSRPLSNAMNVNMFTRIFDYSISHGLIHQRYDMSMSRPFKSHEYDEQAIINSKLTKEEMRRASLRLEYQRIITDNARVTSEVIQLTSTSMIGNAKFADYVKDIISIIRNSKTTHSYRVLDIDGINNFLKEYNKLELINVGEVSMNRFKIDRVQGVILQKDIFKDNTVNEYVELKVPLKYGERL